MKEITSLQHPLVKHLVKIRQNHDYRIDHHSILIEGQKLISEAPVQFKSILTTQADLVPSHVKADEVFLTTPEIIEKISGLKSSEGILAEAVMPKNSDLTKKKLIVALDRINDPGNLGTILRSALAFGWEGVFLLEGCCDPYNDKALRASRGANFKLPVACGNWADLKKLIEENKMKSFVADTEGTECKSIQVSEPILLILGNEASGPSEEAKKISQAVTIPMAGPMESLNVSVAAGILMYTLGKS
jgi:TrmH family RNA methyltransferase